MTRIGDRVCLTDAEALVAGVAGLGALAGVAGALREKRVGDVAVCPGARLGQMASPTDAVTEPLAAVRIRRPALVPAAGDT